MTNLTSKVLLLDTAPHTLILFLFDSVFFIYQHHWLTSVGPAMGRLKGVVLSLGMQVSFLLAYLWQYPLTQPVPEGVPVAELSQEDLKT